MRFVVDEAMWLPEYVRDRLHTEVSLHKNQSHKDKEGRYSLSAMNNHTFERTRSTPFFFFCLLGIQPCQQERRVRIDL